MLCPRRRQTRAAQLAALPEIPPPEEEPLARGEPEAEPEEQVVRAALEDGPARRHTGPYYYVIWAAPKRPDLLGTHRGYWHHIREILPGGLLAGSGVRDCRKCLTEPAAKRYYEARHKGTQAHRVRDHLGAE